MDRGQVRPPTSTTTLTITTTTTTTTTTITTLPSSSIQVGGKANDLSPRRPLTDSDASMAAPPAHAAQCVHSKEHADHSNANRQQHSGVVSLLRSATNGAQPLVSTWQTLTLPVLWRKWQAPTESTTDGVGSHVADDDGSGAGAGTDDSEDHRSYVHLTIPGATYDATTHPMMCGADAWDESHHSGESTHIGSDDCIR